MKKLSVVLVIASLACSTMALAHGRPHDRIWNKTGRITLSHIHHPAPRHHHHHHRPSHLEYHHFPHHHHLHHPRPIMVRPVVTRHYHYPRLTLPRLFSYSVTASRQQAQVRELERENRQLKDQVHRLNMAAIANQSWFCSLKAKNAKYRATGTTKAEAKAKVLENCEQDLDDVWCVDTDVTCET